MPESQVLDEATVKLLDLFCGAGGAALGYARAGFEVTGVDIRPQPTYPYRFIQADAMTFPLDGYDLIHASPPCQGYSPHVSSKSSKWAGTRGADEPRLIAPLLKRLDGFAYVVENVVGAKDELSPNLMLCGVMFGLPIARHRIFRTSRWVNQPDHRSCRGVAKKYAETRGWDYRDMTVTGKGRRAGTADRWKEILGWPVEVGVTQHGLREAIPPVFAEFIGKQLMDAITSVAA